jgi:hypothetical protein
MPRADVRHDRAATGLNEIYLRVFYLQFVYISCAVIFPLAGDYALLWNYYLYSREIWDKNFV